MEHDVNTTAVLGGGCFWCVEAVYKRIGGIVSIEPGYAGGHKDNPTYEEVCTGTTGHAEVVRIRFDPKVIDYEGVLSWFWKCHDPTQLNRQGADTGTQYRSIILTLDEEQAKLARASMEKEQKERSEPVVTVIEGLKQFWVAEAYHHDYFTTHPWNAYCSATIPPKLKKLKLWQQSL